MMKYIPLVICIFPVILLSLSGVAIKYNKAYWLISGYNTMSEENKKNVDIKNMGEFIANILFVMSGIILIAALLIFLNQTLAAVIVFFLMIPVSIYTVIKAQTYDGNTRRPDGTTKTGTKVLIGAVAGFLVLIMAVVGTLLYSSNKPAEYFIQDDTLRISGQYGEEIKLSDIVGITIEEQIPEIQFKINGSDLGNKKKGYFKLKDIGQAKLFVDTQKSPFIFINVKTGLRILNTDEPAATKELYEKLLESWKQNNLAK